ncbi:hypothetical protein M1513_00510 [Patescibacteria group bacterium]|nr:hypothetical protein [Patescibacteria group bacterium]
MISKEKFYKNIGRPIGVYDLKRRRQDALWDIKWRKFLREARIFKYLPFIDFVFASGSMVLGNINESSDFDVLVGCRRNRIFTVRFFTIVALGLLGIRRPRAIRNKSDAKNKICLNHFVTPSSYRLSPPYQIYWSELYENLVPLFGAPEIIEKFFIANNWLNPPRHYFDDVRLAKDGSPIKNIIERLLSGKFGDFIEKILALIQITKITAGLTKHPLSKESRFKYQKDELELHPDTAKFSSLLK